MPSTSTETPKPLVASPFQSESSGISTPTEGAQAACDQGESREIAAIARPAASKSRLLSRRSRSSFVQVGDQS
jgi:hypothetical protein